MDYYIQNEFQIKSTIEEKPGAGGGGGLGPTMSDIPVHVVCM